jgi:DNA-binding NarL/FixJ family response regulator
MKILLADPSPAFRKMLYERLREVPTATVVGQASHEDQAVFLAALCAPDLVLTEQDLGRGGGFSLMERLRAAGYEGLAYMVTTADEAVYGPRCVDAGITGFYDKTYDMERLMQAITVLAQAPVTFGQSRIRASAV